MSESLRFREQISYPNSIEPWIQFNANWCYRIDMNFILSLETRSRIYRCALAPWLLIGHGIPKISHWLLGIETWGAHINYLPKNFTSGAAAVIEFVGPILILLGFKVQISSAFVASMLALSAFTRPLPWFFERVPVEGYAIPFAIIPAKEITVALAMGYFALTLFGQDEKFWYRSKR